VHKFGEKRTSDGGNSVDREKLVVARRFRERSEAGMASGGNLNEKFGIVRPSPFEKGSLAGLTEGEAKGKRTVVQVSEGKKKPGPSRQGGGMGTLAGNDRRGGEKAR